MEDTESQKERWPDQSVSGKRTKRFASGRESTWTQQVSRRRLALANLRLARSIWHGISRAALDALAELSRTYGFSLSVGDLQFLEGSWYATHAGLLRLAQRRCCLGIRTAIQGKLSNPEMNRWVFKATVYKGQGSRGFVGYGDANPSNVSPLVRGAEMRVAETRAVNRALRKAYGIGLCSVEELKWLSGSGTAAESKPAAKSHSQNGSSNGQPRLRDQLCVLIRQYNLDPALVKAYAADFCGTQTLSGASRDLVESFITHLATAARENRDGLICKLNSYGHPVEAQQ